MRIETFNNDVVRESFLLRREFVVEIPFSLSFGQWTVGIIFHAGVIFVNDCCLIRGEGTSDMNPCKIDILRVPRSFDMQFFIATGGEFIRISPTLQFVRSGSLLEVDYGGIIDLRLRGGLSWDHEGNILGAGDDGEGSSESELEHI